MNVLLFYLVAFLNLGYYIFIYGFIHATFNFVFVFDYKLSIFISFYVIFILLSDQKNEARKVTRLKKFKRGTPKAIKFSTELASLKHRENFIAFQ